MSEFTTVFKALELGGPALYPLALLALLALILLIDRGYVYTRRLILSEELQRLSQAQPMAWDELARVIDGGDARNHYLRFCRTILTARGQPLWWVESRAADQAKIAEKSLGRGLWLLETIVTAAPLLGLLGTITGMMQAFNLIGGRGLVDPAGVTGGVAQSLIATAFGIFIALLALFGFNYFTSRQTRALEEMELLGTRLIDGLRLESESTTQHP